MTIFQIFWEKNSKYKEKYDKKWSKMAKNSQKWPVLGLKFTKYPKAPRIPSRSLLKMMTKGHNYYALVSKVPVSLRFVLKNDDLGPKNGHFGLFLAILANF